ncbi:hypothetical protein [Deinococcus ruber]|uniref:Uncharacterized protein n=1 Tax=Deinococcus ruber TaxID=1848197 RepID=A0A918F7T2_9DEIO|nr:hypothetical protein [Deinococcus ruber]GGR17222.1 hypothetical protein GCM10008957_32300 [Deinococcus ruber]
MRTRLPLTAAEIIALENTLPEVFHPDLPVKTLHLMPAGIPAEDTVSLRGTQIVRHLGSLMHKHHVPFPFSLPQVLRIVEPVDAKTNAPIAPTLRNAWLSGQPVPLTPRTRQNRPEHTRFTVYIVEVGLKRLNSLTDTDIRACGVRQVGEQFSFRSSEPFFPTAQLALADHWDSTQPHAPAFENPWVWVLRLEVQPHLSEAATLRETERLLQEWDEIELASEDAYQVYQQLRTQRNTLGLRIIRMLQTRSNLPIMTVGAHRVHLDTGHIKRNTLPGL